MASGFFRYPGGKSKIKNTIVAKLLSSIKADIEYREPFFGGGSIGLALMQCEPKLNKFWINDFDFGISCIWTALIQSPEQFKKLVMDFIPTVEKFYQYKAELLEPHPQLDLISQIVDYGFKKLAIHQISYSGLGTKSGGPLGGLKQSSAYKIDCRWSPDYICKKIDLLNKSFSKLIVRENKCTNLDFENVIDDSSCDAVLYLDPPYFAKGQDLYQHGFQMADHMRLADSLKKTNHQWFLSYDDCIEIREMYTWADIHEINDVSYSITSLKDKETGERLSRTKQELLITRK